MKSTLSQASPFNSALELTAIYTYNGYSDWFLPSRDELIEMQAILTPNIDYGLGASSVTSYWSSSEVSGTNAYRKSLTNTAASALKTQTSYGVRVIRRF